MFLTFECRIVFECIMEQSLTPNYINKPRYVWYLTCEEYLSCFSILGGGYLYGGYLKKIESVFCQYQCLISSEILQYNYFHSFLWHQISGSSCCCMLKVRTVGDFLEKTGLEGCNNGMNVSGVFEFHTEVICSVLLSFGSCILYLWNAFMQTTGTSMPALAERVVVAQFYINSFYNKCECRK